MELNQSVNVPNYTFNIPKNIKKSKIWTYKKCIIYYIVAFKHHQNMYEVKLRNKL